MKVLNFLRPENGLTEDPLYYLGFEQFEQSARDCYLFMADFEGDLRAGHYDDKERVVLTLEEPNFCTGDGFNAVLEDYADTILTLCPYTASLFEKRRAVFFPLNEALVPAKQDKTIDVSYFGSHPRHIPWREFLSEVVFPLNHRYGNYTEGNMRGCSYAEKLDALSRSKIALVHGLCTVNPTDIWRYKNFPRAAENLAFSHLHDGILPQIKSRMFEGAFCRSLLLCYRDHWNPIEQYFTPGEEFLYFSDLSELRDLAAYVLANYEEFDGIREAAFQRAMDSYTTRHFVEEFLT